MLFVGVAADRPGNHSAALTATVATFLLVSIRSAAVGRWVIGNVERPLYWVEASRSRMAEIGQNLPVTGNKTLPLIKKHPAAVLDVSEHNRRADWREGK